MTGNGRAQLYSPKLLALATDLASYPLDDDFDLVGSARSKTCGSTLQVGIKLTPMRTVERLGLQASSCAVGQAAAAIFAKGAIDKDGRAIELACKELVEWLSGTGNVPHWPGIEAIAPALAYPARHGAILLPWKAAIDALCNETASS